MLKPILGRARQLVLGAQERLESRAWLRVGRREFTVGPCLINAPVSGRKVSSFLNHHDAARNLEDNKAQ